MTDPRRPYHLGVFLGLSATAYAVFLAGVTGLQAGADGAVVAARAPDLQAAAQVAAEHDQLEAHLESVASAYARAALRYEQLGSGLGDLESSLGDLSAIVSSVQGAARALPARVALPPVSRTVVRVAAPAVHATTGASGG